jgi:hypothetical protein
MSKSLLLLLGSLCALAVSGYAATLTGTVDINPATSVNLTSANTLAWSIWNESTSSGFSSLSATNAQSVGAGLISAITPFATTSVATNEVRGVGGAAELFTYTNGISPTSQTDAALRFVTNSTLATAGRGVQVSITGSSSQLYRVDVWTVGFAGQGDMRASLNGASTVVLTSEIFGTDGGNKASNLFSFFFTPDSNSDLLNLSFYLRSNDVGASAHVGIQAITVSAVAVPEPATYTLLMGFSGLAFAFLRRSRRA